jgi:hypothetical protein
MTVLQQEGLKRIYEKKKQTIDYIFKIGSNVLREAFLVCSTRGFATGML